MKNAIIRTVGATNAAPSILPVRHSDSAGPWAVEMKRFPTAIRKVCAGFGALMVAAIAAPLPALAEDAPAIAQEETVSPERQKLAEEIAAQMLPEGIYEQMMRDQMKSVADSMVGSIMGLDAGMLAAMAGPEGSEERADAEAELGDDSFEELMTKLDPHFRERMRITFDVMFEEMAPLMGKMEPKIRDAFADIYARRYDADQLSDMLAFFGTPSGEAFAANFMTLFFEKEFMDASMAMVPEMMKAMPQIMQKVEAATAHLPDPPKPCDIDPDSPACTGAEPYSEAMTEDEVAQYPAYWSDQDVARLEAIWDEAETAYARYDSEYETVDAAAKARIDQTQ